MKKGRYGIVLCFLPVFAFFCVILKLPFIWVAPVFAVFVERDEWAARQTLQALMLYGLVMLFTELIPWAVGLIPLAPVNRVLSVAATVCSVLVYLAAIVFSILAILRVSKDRDADIPGLSDLAYRAFGQCKPRPVPVPPQMPQQPGQPMPQQPMQAQPVPPAQAPAGQPGTAQAPQPAPALQPEEPRP